VFHSGDQNHQVISGGRGSHPCSQRTFSVESGVVISGPCRRVSQATTDVQIPSHCCSQSRSRLTSSWQGPSFWKCHVPPFARFAPMPPTKLPAHSAVHTIASRYTMTPVVANNAINGSRKSSAIAAKRDPSCSSSFDARRQTVTLLRVSGVQALSVRSRRALQLAELHRPKKPVVGPFKQSHYRDATKLAYTDFYCYNPVSLNARFRFEVAGCASCFENGGANNTASDTRWERRYSS